MSWWGVIGTFGILWIVAFVVFGFIPTSTLISFMTLLYSLWWSQVKEKRVTTLSVLALVGAVATIIFIGVLPILSLFPLFSYLYRVTAVLTPDGALHAWFDEIPSIIGLMIPFSIFTVLLFKIVFSILSGLNIVKRDEIQKDCFLGMAKVNAYIGLLTIVLVILQLGIPDITYYLLCNQIFRIFYEICFAYIPFVTFFFLLDFIWSRIWGKMRGQFHV